MIPTTISPPLWLLLDLDPTTLLLFSTTLLSILVYYTTIHLTTIITNDYRAFLSLGPGGTPSTPQGYLRIKFLSLFALKDPYTPSYLPSTPSLRGRLCTPLPQRAGPRPVVAGIAPHRQRSQRPPAPIFASLRAGIEQLAHAHPRRLLLGTSCLEKHGPGLFVVPAGAWGEMTALLRCGREVCHAHPSDGGSLHLTLHPADEANVLNAGWGELHPLARGGWLTRFVPQRFMMVYAPRDEAELEVVLAVVKAAVWWVGGVEVEGVKVGAKWIKGEEEMVDVEREREVDAEVETRRAATACMPGLVDATQDVMID
jgi:hypothetical protein